MSSPKKTETKPSDDSSTGLPWPKSWRGVYVFVFGCFVTYVVVLTWFTRHYS
jgi:hypothetical protein